MTTKQPSRYLLLGTLLVIISIGLTGCAGGGQATLGWAGLTVEGENLYMAYRTLVFAFAGGDAPVTYGEGDAKDPAWSQDGEAIAYARVVDDHYQIFVRQQGFEAAQVTDAEQDHASPAFSPDGTQLVYVAGDDLYIIDVEAEDAEPVRLTNTSAVEADPAWSPDRDLIVYVSDVEGNFDLWSIATDGTGAARFTRTSTNADERDPVWSPDGTLIAYVADFDDNLDIYTTRFTVTPEGEPQGEGRERITDDPADDLSPSWEAPDGAHILFTSDRNGTFDLFQTVPRQSARAVLVAETGDIDEMAPQWQPGEVGAAEDWVLYQATVDGVTHIYQTNAERQTVVNEPTWWFGFESKNNIHFYAPPTVAGDRIYVGAFDRRVYAINTTDGSQVMTDKLDGDGDPIPWVTDKLPDLVVDGITVGDGLIYVPIANRNVVAYDIDDPEEPVWTFKTDHGCWSKPLLVNDVLYVASLDHHIYAVDAQTGDELWQSDDLNGAVPGRITYDAERQRLYIGTLNAQVYALNMEGQIVNTFDTEDWVWGQPMLYDDTLYFADMSGWVYAIEPGADWDTTSALIWKEQVAEKDGIRAPLLVTEDLIYVALQNGFLYARDRADGSNVWRSPSSEDSTLGALLSAPVYMSGNVLVSPMNESIELVAYDADDGTRRWYFPLQAEE